MDASSPSEIYLFDNFRLDRRGGGLFRCAEAGGPVPVSLGSRALDVLRVLIERHGDLVAKDDLMAAVWPNTVVEEANLTVQISTLRRVLDNGRPGPSIIQTAPGRGYRFLAAVTRLEPGPDADVSPTATISDGSTLSAAERAPLPLPDKASLFVLPFQNISGDSEQEYFADGIVEEITTALARVRGEGTRPLMSLNSISDESAFSFDDFRLDRRDGLFRRHESGQEQPVTLGSRALDVLMALVERHGTLATKHVLMDAAWPGRAVEDANLTVQISSLRRVLDEDRTGGSCIQTVTGRGYRFVPSVVVGLPPGAQTTGAPPSLSLVVLPFDNLGAESDDDYLVAGVTDDLTTALSHIPGTFVISRATAYSYRGKAEDIRRIGRDLGVRYVVRGSLRRFGSTLRVNAELSSTETGAHLWSDSFDQKVADLASGQEQIVIRMRAALNVSLADTEAARSLRERPTNPDAFDFILRARAVWLLPHTKDTMAQAVGLYQQALSRDPNAVLALVGAVVALLDEQYLGGLSSEVGMDEAEQYLGRAKMLAPNSEAVLAAEAMVVEYRGHGLDYQRTRPEQKAVSQRLIDLYPNNPSGYFRLGVLARQEGRYDECAEYFARYIRLNPRGTASKTAYWNMAYCLITAGHDREGLEWVDRTMAAPGSLPSFREAILLGRRVVAYFRTGAVETAKRLAAELNARFPFWTWRASSPEDLDSEADRNRYRSIQEALKAAGSRDHLDPDADFGVTPDNVLHEYFGKTPTTVPGVTTVNTEQLASMLKTEKPLVIDTMDASWYRSVPGAVGLDFNGDKQGTFTDAVQKRLEQKLRALTGDDVAKPIVAMGFNVGRFDGYNLALRLRHAGYTNVYWYRGGREAWEVAGKPEDVVLPADW